MYEAKFSWIFFGTLLLAVAWGFWLKKNEPEEPEAKPEWVLIGDKLVEKRTKEPFQGEREMPFLEAPTMIQWIYTYVDGVRQGPATEFYAGPIPKVKMRANFVDGVRQGAISTYQRNGVIKSEGTAVDGKIAGLVTFYNRDGTVNRREVYEDSFPSNHPTITAVPELVEEEIAERDPELISESDERIDPPLILDMTGKPFTGIQVGTFYGGKKAFEHSYKDGRLHGEYVAWDTNGKLEHERPHYEGKKHGRWRHWSAGNFLVSEDHFQHGLQVGSSKRWHPQSEQLQQESQFEHGAEHGTRKVYARDGTEISQLLFDHGIQIRKMESGAAVEDSPLTKGLTLTIEASEAPGVHVIGLDPLPADFEGLAVVDFRFRLSSPDADLPPGTRRAFRVSFLHNDEVAEVAQFDGDLGGWIIYKERMLVEAGAAVKCQIDVPAGHLIIDFAGVRLRDVTEDED